MSRKALGKGLGALIGSQSSLADPKPRADLGESVQQIPLSSLVPSPLQPRKRFVPEQLEELSASIKARGIVQPLITRKVGDKYELIAGERRWRASQAAGLATAPVIVRQATDLEVLELALVENLQRADLNPIEEAEGYRILLDRFELTQEQVAEQVGKSRVAVANALRLLSLSADVREMIGQNQISVGHAKVILGLGSDEARLAAAHEVVKRGLTVRQTEQLVRKAAAASGKKSPTGKGSSPASGSADWRDMELRLQRALGTKARIVGTSGKGHIEVDYFSATDLDRILEQLGVKLEG
jgi:ParB family chromosome partitioning protein